VLEERLLILGIVVLGVLRNVAEFARDADPVRNLAPFLVREVLDLRLELLVSLWSEDDFLHNLPFPKEKRGAIAPSRARIVAIQSDGRNIRAIYDSRSMQVNLHDTWYIGPIEIPSRLVLAPMAGVSVQAFRRQGRRFGAGLVCSEMVSCAGLQHGNERTLGYLRIAADERPLAVQIFGSDPAVMAQAAAMVEEAGADIVDINFGCPVKKVTKTGAGATLLDEPERACRVVEAVASSVSVPVTVKLRRGLENGSRACLSLGPRLVEAGAASLTLHPRSAKQMYTGSADHSLTAELVSLVEVPVVASGDITSRTRAESVLATTGATAVMVGRAAQGNPWALREILEGDAAEPSREEVVAELILFMRETVRELGEHRATGFLRKFYGWYLGRGRFPRAFKAELTQLPTLPEVEARLLAAAPGARFVLARLEETLPEGDEVLLDLPISIYGGG
jgi:tRNA-dihydrouridine synthase B